MGAHSQMPMPNCPYHTAHAILLPKIQYHNPHGDRPMGRSATALAKRSAFLAKRDRLAKARRQAAFLRLRRPPTGPKGPAERSGYCRTVPAYRPVPPIGGTALSGLSIWRRRLCSGDCRFRQLTASAYGRSFGRMLCGGLPCGGMRCVQPGGMRCGGLSCVQPGRMKAGLGARDHRAGRHRVPGSPGSGGRRRTGDCPACGGMRCV